MHSVCRFSVLRRELLPFLPLFLFLAAVPSEAEAEEAVLRSRHVIEDIAWIPQTWNNCGPATLAMALDRWGVPATQQEIADLIRPNAQDGHVAVEQLVAASSSRGMDSLFIPSGSLDLVKAFVARGFPVMMPTWHIDENGSQMGHYRLVHGYDDELGSFFLRDSLEPVGYSMDYRTFDVLWRVFNRRMLIVHPPGLSDDVERIAVPAGSEAEILEGSLARAVLETVPSGDLPGGMSRAHYLAYSYFNRASALTSLGRYDEAAEALLAAFETGLPWRMLWYQPEVLESLFRTGEYSRIVAVSTRALEPYPYLEELWYWRGRAEKALGRMEAAEAAFRSALEIRPGWSLAVRELRTGD